MCHSSRSCVIVVVYAFEVEEECILLLFEMACWLEEESPRVHYCCQSDCFHGANKTVLALALSSIV